MSHLIKSDFSIMVPEIISKLESSGIKIMDKSATPTLVQLKTSVGLLRLYKSKKGTTVDDTYFKASVIELLGIDELNKEINKIRTNVIGVDESGKGDYFGPLVVAGVYLEDGSVLDNLGLKDSKKLTDAKALQLNDIIQKKCPVEILKLNPSKYNEIYSSMNNLNSMLAWAHAKVIDKLAKDGATAISDKFADDSLIKSRIRSGITLIQRTKAETNIAVAAASVVARAEFLLEIQKYSFEFGMEIPKGAGQQVLDIGRKLVQENGTDILKRVAKLHFSTTEQISKGLNSKKN